MLADMNLFDGLHETHPKIITVGDGNRRTATRMGDVLILLDLQGKWEGYGEHPHSQPCPVLP